MKVQEFLKSRYSLFPTFAGKDCHLRRRARVFSRWSDWAKHNGITETLRNICCPRVETRPVSIRNGDLDAESVQPVGSQSSRCILCLVSSTQPSEGAQIQKVPARKRRVVVKSKCSITSITAAASYPARRLSR